MKACPEFMASYLNGGWPPLSSLNLDLISCRSCCWCEKPCKLDRLILKRRSSLEMKLVESNYAQLTSPKTNFCVRIKIVISQFPLGFSLLIISYCYWKKSKRKSYKQKKNSGNDYRPVSAGGFSAINFLLLLKKATEKSYEQRKPQRKRLQTRFRWGFLCQ